MATLMPPALIGYRIDAHDVIDEVSDSFAEFARQNGAAGLEEKVLGSSLWDHVLGAEVQAVYRDLLAHARRTGRPVVFPYRCDAPDCRRFLEMRMRRSEAGSISFESRVRREEARAPVDLLEVARQTEPGLLVMCAWCRKIEADGWVEIEEGIRRLGLFNQTSFPCVTHGMCLPCKDVAMAELNSLRPLLKQ